MMHMDHARGRSVVDMHIDDRSADEETTPKQPMLKSPSTSSSDFSCRGRSAESIHDTSGCVGDGMLRDFMSSVSDPDKTWFSMMQCLVLLHYECDVHPNTLHLATQMAARFLSKQSFLQTESEANLRLIASLAIFSSAKFEDGYSLRVNKFLQSIGGGYEEETFLRAEVSFCHLVDFDFFQQTRFAEGMRILTENELCHVATDVSQKYVRVKQNFLNETLGKNSKESLRIGFLVRYLLELSLWDLEMFRYEPEVVARAAVHLAKHYLPEWTPESTGACRMTATETAICQRLYALAQMCAMDSELGARIYGSTKEKMRSNKTTIKYSKTAFLGVTELTWTEFCSARACFLS
jgi:hypothetical protein